MKINATIANYIKSRKKQGKNVFLLMGSRRSGKTYSIAQYLVLQAYKKRCIINVAGMTMEQLRNGVYADMKEIIENEPILNAIFEFYTAPREIRNTINGSRISFNSYQNPETAKGFKCNYLYINEINNFSKEQYFALTPNATDGIFADWNPTKHFFIEDLFSEDEILRINWQSNPFLTDLQKDYFYGLEKAALKPGASSVDIWLYKVNFLGEYSNDLAGEVFKADNINISEAIPGELKNICAFVDPSALRGSDYTAAILSAKDNDNNYIILDTLLQNKGTYDEIAKRLEEWSRSWGNIRIYVETNGYIGIEFYEFLQRNYRRLNINSWYSRGNKFERIIAQYGNISDRTKFIQQPNLQICLDQLYDFGQKSEHDDFADCLASSIMLQNFK